MLRVRLKKLESNHNRLRTDEIEGKCTHVPEVGYSFQMFGEALDPAMKKVGGFRTVTTSTVQFCEYLPGTKTFRFQTRNSKYQLEVLDDKDPMEYTRWKPSTQAA